MPTNSATPQHAELVDLILSNITDGVFTVNRRFQITFFNAAAAELTGFSVEEALGQQCRDIFRTPICDQDCPLRQAFRLGRRVKNFEIDTLTKSGKPMTISACAAPLVNWNGELIGGVETFRNVSATHPKPREIARGNAFHDIIARTPRMRQIFQTLPNIAQSDATVLLQGRSGTGKELFANAIHHLSPRAKGPLITVNCGALPETLLESELFGYVKGAFTDAKQDRVGRFQAAEGGTIFLDEIGDAPLSIQVKLLRVLETREFQSLGSDRTINVDVRVVAATNQDLNQLVATGRFREDLYYRLNVILIQIPDLRERLEDVPLLIDHFIDKLGQRTGRNIQGLTERAMAVLMAYDYPGNVRELENIVEHAYIISSGPYVRVQDLPHHLVHGQANGRRPDTVAYWGPQYEPDVTPRGFASSGEAEAIRACLHRNFWSIPRAAKELGMHRTTLWRKVKRFKIELPK
ncbi:MAG: sigma 54-interacting transcriptional regulator [Myxococcota bacterium]|nr:sigma 54-interacting transcriptional regulator [Myxococcota bacterium]